MRKGIFVGVLVFAGLAGTGYGSEPSPSEGASFKVPLDKKGCPLLKLEHPLAQDILKSFDSAAKIQSQGQLQKQVTINGGAWALILDMNKKPEPKQKWPSPAEISTPTPIKGQPGACHYQYYSPKGPHKDFVLVPRANMMAAPQG